MISLFVLVMNYSTHCNHICCNDAKLSLHHLYLQGKSCDELYHPFQTFTRMSSTKRQTSLFVTYDIDKKQVHLLKNCCIARRLIEYYSVNLFKFRANRYSKYISQLSTVLTSKEILHSVPINEDLLSLLLDQINARSSNFKKCN